MGLCKLIVHIHVHVQVHIHIYISIYLFKSGWAIVKFNKY